MKVVQLEFYRIKREIELLEKKLQYLSTARELKMTYQEWLKRQAGSKQ